MIIDSNQKVLIVAAHQDDEVLGCGGLIVKLLKKGAKIKVLTLGDGVSSRFKSKSLKNIKVQKAIKKRTIEAKKALKFLGINDYYFGKYPDNRLDEIPILDVIRMVEKHIGEFKPNVILTHNQFDTNVDHQISYKAVEVATRPTRTNSVKKVYTFEIIGSGDWTYNKRFVPTTYINIEKEFKKKIDAWKFYASELQPFPFPRSIEGIKNLAMYRGMQSGQIMAEAYKLEREII